MATLLLSSLALLPLTLTAAQSTPSSCPGPLASAFNSSVDTANATGTYELPGVSLGSNGLSLSNGPSQSWHLSQTVTRYGVNTPFTIGNTYLTVPSPPNSSAQAQYVTCAQWFVVPDDMASASQADDGSCSTVFGADCLRDLRDLYLTHARASAGQQHTADQFCDDFVNTVGGNYPVTCQGNTTDKILKGVQGKKSGFLFFSTKIRVANERFFPAVEDCYDQPIGATNVTSPISILIEYFDTHSWNPMDFGGALMAAPEDVSNFSVYDAAVRSIRPFIIVRMENATTTATTNSSFADVQMVCVRAKDVKAGSRVPSAESAGAMVRVGAFWTVRLAALVGALAAL